MILPDPPPPDPLGAASTHWLPDPSVYQIYSRPETSSHHRVDAVGFVGAVLLCMILLDPPPPCPDGAACTHWLPDMSVYQTKNVPDTVSHQSVELVGLTGAVLLWITPPELLIPVMFEPSP